MKEKKLSNKKIIDTLVKKSFLEIAPICDECICRVMLIVLEVFTSAHFDVFQIEDNLYCLRISV